MVWIKIGHFEIIPVEIWTQNQERSVELYLKRAAVHYDVLQFCKENNINIFGRP